MNKVRTPRNHIARTLATEWRSYGKPRPLMHALEEAGEIVDRLRDAGLVVFHPEQDREWLASMMRDPTIFFVEEQEHAEDYWKRQANRAIDVLVSRQRPASKPCPTCHGAAQDVGWIDHGASMEAGAPIRRFDPCKDCSGTGQRQKEGTK